MLLFQKYKTVADGEEKSADLRNGLQVDLGSSYICWARPYGWSLLSLSRGYVGETDITHASRPSIPRVGLIAVQVFSWSRSWADVTAGYPQFQRSAIGPMKSFTEELSNVIVPKSKVKMSKEFSFCIY
jgi:hypothetical protein